MSQTRLVNLYHSHAAYLWLMVKKVGVFMKEEKSYYIAYGMPFMYKIVAYADTFLEIMEKYEILKLYILRHNYSFPIDIVICKGRCNK